MAKLELAGVIPPLPTPTYADGTVDVETLRRVIDYVIANGATGVVPIGGVGEFNSLSRASRQQVVAETVRHVNGCVPVVAGVVQTSFHDAVESALEFKDAGADAVLTLAPYYQKPTQDGVRAYFEAFKRKTDIPVIVYDTPDQTHLVLRPDTIAAMAADGSIDALKASNSGIDHFNRVVHLLGGRIPLLAGETPFFPVFVAMGADGGMIGNSCFMPRYFVRMFGLARDNRLAEALAAHRKLLGLTDALAAAGYFSAFKQMLALIGLDCGAPLLPLQPAKAETFARVKQEFDALKADGTLDETAPPA